MKLIISLSYTVREIEHQIRSLESRARYMDPERYDRLSSVLAQRLRDAQRKTNKASVLGNLRGIARSKEASLKDAFAKVERDAAVQALADYTAQGRISPTRYRELERRAVEVEQRLRDCGSQNCG